MVISNLYRTFKSLFFEGISVTINEPRTRQPPIIILIVIFSDKNITEENTVTTGSTAETRDAMEGPVIFIPVKKDQKANTVETTAVITTAIIPLKLFSVG